MNPGPLNLCHSSVERRCDFSTTFPDFPRIWIFLSRRLNVMRLKSG